MSQQIDIDVTFDFRSDTRAGKDPDKDSPTLRRYHQQLWSKPLPSGAQFNLSVATSGEYLHHQSEIGDFSLSSDSVLPTFDYWKIPPPYLKQVPETEQEDFARLTYTMAGMMVFWSHQIERQQTINQARGTTKTIGDRFDLTLECIRRHYLGEGTAFPLAVTLTRYTDFFALFGDFRGYVDFFLLQDLVTDDYSTVRFFSPFANFTTPAVPQTLDGYRHYRQLTVEFIDSRNRRIAASLQGHQSIDGVGESEQEAISG